VDSRNGCALRIGWVQKLITFSSGCVGLQKLIRRKCNEIGKGEQKKIKKVIDETRRELLELWHGKEAVHQWDRAWERTTTWELEEGERWDGH